jgi:signal transduction histidine kinase
MLASGELGYYQVEKRYICKNGQVRWCELTVSRIKRKKGGRPNRAIAIVDDITERQRAQEALHRAERLALAGRLGASLAHEINNPLQSVIGCLGLAEEMLDEGAEVRHYLEIAIEELERAAGIVNQLRDLSRQPKDKKKKPTDLNTLIEKTLTLTRKRCQNRRVKVVWSPATDLPPVPLVPDRIQQVFLNLVLNAVEAMPGGGQLQVGTNPTTQPKGVDITVVDSGVGIEPERLPRIFEPFQSTRDEGLGLGLYISKKIVEEHDGHIEVDSHPGEGTTFNVWLPI